MKPRERRETGAQNMFRSRLDQIINMKHELVKLAKAVSYPMVTARIFPHSYFDLLNFSAVVGPMQ